jgi:hypothetical protein
MSVCNKCLDAPLVDFCSGSLVIGGVPLEATFTVYIQHNATGLLQAITVQSNASGYTTIPLGPNDIILDALQGYTLWLTYGEANSTQLSITVGEEFYYCINIQTVKSVNPPEITWINP